MCPIKKKKEKLHFSTALLIDMQPDFVEDLLPSKAEEIIAAQITVLRHCARSGIPVIVLEFITHGRTLPGLWAEAERVVGMQRVIKERDDGFRGTPLSRMLADQKAKSLLLMGINASFCVFETARTAVQLGYRIVTASDLIADSRRDTWGGQSLWYKANGTLLSESRELALA
jgi:nicotinamidase-related amidase